MSPSDLRYKRGAAHLCLWEGGFLQYVWHSCPRVWVFLELREDLLSHLLLNEKIGLAIEGPRLRKRAESVPLAQHPCRMPLPPYP